METIEISMVAPWSYAKDNLMLCLQPKSNENILKRNFLDLELYVRVKADTVTYKVKPGMFNVSEEEIFNRALELLENNTTCRDWYGTGMFALSNGNYAYGASAICNMEVLKKIASELNDDLIILPSSIHECIIKPKGIKTLAECSEIVHEVNNEQVAPEEVLSNHAYQYNKDTGIIFW